jgi:hypothetical protein
VTRSLFPTTSTRGGRAWRTVRAVRQTRGGGAVHAVLPAPLLLQARVLQAALWGRRAQLCSAASRGGEGGRGGRARTRPGWGGGGSAVAGPQMGGGNEVPSEAAEVKHECSICMDNADDAYVDGGGSWAVLCVRPARLQNLMGVSITPTRTCPNTRPQCLTWSASSLGR